MQNVTITSKFLLLLAAFGLFALGTAFYSGRQIKAVDAGYSYLLFHEADASTALSRASRALQSVRGSISDVLMSTDADMDKAALNKIALGREQFSGFMDKAIADLPDDAVIKDLKQKALEAVDKNCQKAVQLGTTAIGYLELKSATASFFQQCHPHFEEMTAAFVAKVGELAKVTSASSAQLADHAQDTYWSTITSVIVGIVIISLVSFFAIRTWLVKPVRTLSNVMRRLADGDLTAEVAGADRKDEVGGMARAVQVFKDNGMRTLELEQETAAQRHQSEEQQRRAAEQDRIRAESMAQATNGLADGLKQLSAGNLTFQLSQPFAADFESLRSDFNSAVEQLRGTLGAVSQATSSIDSGSREVSQSADDLAKRTEQQAASLEQTAAALDEITANVSNSSKRAEEARTVTIQANESARHSGNVVANAVDAMGKIEQSSSQISSIISVIDEIAFQTNLLALNAGVEAARAGEAGKGFAVVAQEVRELAQRSAKAAKEIKDLIRNSSVDVESGVKLVSETGDALKTIEGYIVTINQHMDSIATSAREQSVGLSEVNTAVNQMDQVTQQNAAMVEEANAAGATLANEAARLRELIGRFDLGAGASLSQSNQLRRTAQVMAASPQSRPAASPARSMVGKIAPAFTGRSSAAAAPAAAADSWEEF
jgi:methyl-accepting chemotaxis protein